MAPGPLDFGNREPGYSVLVVDDEPGIRELLVRVLEDYGHRAESAGSGTEALDLIRTRGETYDLALLDLMLPGCNGLELLEEIRRRHPAMAVIMVSAFGTMETAMDALRRGADDFLVKPIRSLKELAAAAEHTVVRRRRYVQSMASLGGQDFRDTLVRVVSHEIRTPATLIRGASSMLERLCGDELSSDAHRLIAMIRSGSERLSEILDRLSLLVQLERGWTNIRNQTFSPAGLVDEIIAGIQADASDRGVRIEVGAPYPLQVEGDRDLTGYALDALLSNAVKFNRPQGSVRVGFEPADGGWWCTVQDTGPGIPPERLGELFEPFSQAEDALTREHGGVGIGLSLVDRVVRTIDGRVEVQTEEGRGSTFRIFFPSPMLAAGIA